MQRLLFLFALAFIVSACSSNESDWLELGNGKFVNLSKVTSISFKANVTLKDSIGGKEDTVLYNDFMQISDFPGIPDIGGNHFNLRCGNLNIHNRDSIIGTLVIYFDNIDYLVYNRRYIDNYDHCSGIQYDIGGGSLRREIDKLLNPTFEDKLDKLFDVDEYPLLRGKYIHMSRHPNR